MVLLIPGKSERKAQKERSVQRDQLVEKLSKFSLVVYLVPKSMGSVFSLLGGGP